MRLINVAASLFVDAYTSIDVDVCLKSLQGKHLAVLRVCTLRAGWQSRPTEPDSPRGLMLKDLKQVKKIMG